MLKKYGQLYNSALFISDSLVICLSWLAAYYFRFYWQWVPVTRGIPPISLYLTVLPPVAVIFLFNSKMCGLYEPLRGRSHMTQVYNIVKVCALSIFMIAALSFFYRGASFSRVVMVYFWVLCTVGMVLSHTLVRQLFMKLRKAGYHLDNVLIVGAGELGQSVAEKIDLHPEIGFSVAGYLTTHPEKVGSTVGSHKVLGLNDEVSAVIRKHDIQQLFIALPMGAHDRLEQTLSHLGEETVDIKVVPDLMRFMNIHSGVEDFDGLPVVSLTGTPLYGWNVVIKRTTDFVLSALAILFGIPLMGLIALAIRLESPGPVIYRQDRVGLDGRVFPMLKFRSMRIGAEKSTGPVWAQENDNRRTKVGAFLRETSLDELPQLINVLKGEMSLVGPRPERPVFVEGFKKSIPQYVLRLKMKAGLTGWAQVNGWRGNTSLEKRIEYDIYYIKNWSFFFDLKIIWMTLWKGFVNRHAY